jgi:hypothetical protein
MAPKRVESKGDLPLKQIEKIRRLPVGLSTEPGSNCPEIPECLTRLGNV